MTEQIGFLVNPIAGMGGRVGLKGTDGVLKKAVYVRGKISCPQKAEEMLREFCAISSSHSDFNGSPAMERWEKANWKLLASKIYRSSIHHLEIRLQQMIRKIYAKNF